ncbi:MAG: hypothetical protein ACXIUQ_19505 [Cecembia sp.]
MDIFFKLLPTKNKCHTREDCQFILNEMFIEFAEFDYWKSDLQVVLKNAFSCNISFPKESPGSLLFFGSQFNKLIFASFYLFRKHKNSTLDNPDWQDLIDQGSIKSKTDLLDRIHFLPKSLSKSEVQNPNLFLNSFFYHKSLKKWIKHWNVLLEFSISNISLKEFHEFDEKQTKWLFGLLEANYLIYVRDFQKKE